MRILDAAGYDVILIETVGAGLPELWAAIERHGAHLRESGTLAGRLKNQARAELLKSLDRQWHRHVQERAAASGSLARLAEEVASKRLDTHSAATLLWEELGWKQR